MKIDLHLSPLSGYERSRLDVTDEDRSISNMGNLFAVEASMIAEQEDLEPEATAIELHNKN